MVVNFCKKEDPVYTEGMLNGRGWGNVLRLTWDSLGEAAYHNG